MHSPRTSLWEILPVLRSVKLVTGFGGGGWGVKKKSVKL